jgi:hypothetical protein
MRIVEFGGHRNVCCRKDDTITGHSDTEALDAVVEGRVICGEEKVRR